MKLSQDNANRIFGKGICKCETFSLPIFYIRILQWLLL